MKPNDNQKMSKGVKLWGWGDGCYLEDDQLMPKSSSDADVVTLKIKPVWLKSCKTNIHEI